jgi:hypothetical protein
VREGQGKDEGQKEAAGLRRRALLLSKQSRYSMKKAKPHLKSVL